MQGEKVFLCYRRDDTSGHAGRVYDRLNARFPGRVFMDVKGIGLAQEWQKVIEQVLRSCRVFVPLIGKRWLEAEDGGVSRLHDPADQLRWEITTALQLRLTIIPVLVDDAGLPTAAQLPPEIVPILKWQALRIDNDDFDHDIGKLISTLELAVGEQPQPERPPDWRVAQQQRLIAEAQAAMRTGDWMSARQLLQSTLSLDPNQPDAAALLRQVIQHGEQASRQGHLEQIRGHEPAERKPARGRFKLMLGTAAATVLGLGLIGYFYESEENGFVPAPLPSPQPAPVQSSGLAGRYTLQQYFLRGVHVPASGSMHISQAAPDTYDFSAALMVGAYPVAVQSRGRLFRSAGVWYLLVSWSTDPSAITPQPVMSTVAFNGTALQVANFTGQMNWLIQR